MDGTELFRRIIIIIAFVISEVHSDRCITPNGEEAECISIYSCLKLTNGNINEDKDAKEFVRRSYCGFDRDPLICCGSDIKSSKLLSYLRHSKFHISFDDADEGCNNCNTSANLNLNNAHRRTSKTSKYLDSGENSANKDCNSSAFLKLIKPRKNLENRASRKARSIKRKLKGSNYGDRRYCGKQRTKVVDEFPWLAHLRYSHRNKTNAGFKCVGALISERHVLTAARCIVPDNSTELELVSVQLGQLNEKRIQKCNGNTCNNAARKLGIEKLIPHPGYDVQKNDIGLIKLDASVLSSDYIRPICLTYKKKQLAKFSKFSVILEESYKNFKKINTWLDKCSKGNDFICTVYPPTQTRISSSNNTGAPLMFLYKHQWYLEGILSSAKDFKLISTRVSNYIGWILDNSA